MTIKVRIHFDDGETTIEYTSKKKNFKSFVNKFFDKDVFTITDETGSMAIATGKVFFIEQIWFYNLFKKAPFCPFFY